MFIYIYIYIYIEREREREREWESTQHSLVYTDASNIPENVVLSNQIILSDILDKMSNVMIGK